MDFQGKTCPEFEGDLDDYRTPDRHQTTCENSVRRFYLVKLHEFRNPNLVAAEEIRRHRRVIIEFRRKKSVYKDQLSLSLYCSSCSRKYRKKMMEDLEVLRVSLDKLTFANKRSVIKSVGPNSSLEEIDNLGLHFGMLHGSNNLADERKILKKTRLTRRKTNSIATLEDYDRRIRALRLRFNSGRHDSAMEKQWILMEIPEMKVARDTAIQNAVCKGEMWESLGDKDGIQDKIKIMKDDIDASRGTDLEIAAEDAFALREFEAVDKDLARLDKQLSDMDEIIEGAYKCFLQWRNEHQQANVGYNQNVLLLNDARKLAEKMDLASLRSLCEQQTATFMEKWTNDGDFRSDYKRRASISLNSRGLCFDGRTRNPDEAPIDIGGQTVKIPRRLLRSVVRNPPGFCTEWKKEGRR